MSSRQGQAGSVVGSGRHSGAVARLAVRLSPTDVGRRVTIRHRLDADTLTDVVGALVSWDGGWGGELVVERRDGSRAVVPAARIVAARVVPPEISAEALQEVAQAGWPPAETAPLGDWTLRAGPDGTGRTGSVRVAGRPDRPLPETLDAVSRWYADRGRSPLLQVPAPSAYDEDLDALGWSVTRRTLLRTAPLGEVLARSADRPIEGLVVTRTAEPGHEWLALVEPELDPAALARVLTAPREVVVVEVRDAASGDLLGTGRASAAASAVGRWAGITSIATAPAGRRRGVATRVMHELASWATDAGCTRAYLQVLEDNEPARSLYDRLGFDVHHRYEYRSPNGAVRP